MKFTTQALDVLGIVLYCIVLCCVVLCCVVLRYVASRRVASRCVALRCIVDGCIECVFAKLHVNGQAYIVGVVYRPNNNVVRVLWILTIQCM